MRRSRTRLASSARRRRATRLPIAIPTANMTPKVMTWRTSETASVYCGGTKKKSYDATDSAAANAPGPRPPSAASMIANRNSIASSGRSSRAPASTPIAVAAATATPAQGIGADVDPRARAWRRRRRRIVARGDDV